MQSIEFCAGAGGQALGLEMAGFRHSALVELESDYAKTLQLNRPHWAVHTADMNAFDGRPYKGMDLLAGGLPCPPFSVAGKQLGRHPDLRGKEALQGAWREGEVAGHDMEAAVPAFVEDDLLGISTGCFDQRIAVTRAFVIERPGLWTGRVRK